MDMDLTGEDEGGMNWGIRTDIYTLPCVNQTASGSLLPKHRELGLGLCGGLAGWVRVGSRKAHQGGDTYIHTRMPEGLHSAEANTVL